MVLDKELLVLIGIEAKRSLKRSALAALIAPVLLLSFYAGIIGYINGSRSTTLPDAGKTLPRVPPAGLNRNTPRVLPTFDGSQTPEESADVLVSWIAESGVGELGQNDVQSLSSTGEEFERVVSSPEFKAHFQKMWQFQRDKLNGAWIGELVSPTGKPLESYTYDPETMELEFKFQSNTPVFAVSDGTVLEVLKPDKKGSKGIVLQHSDGFRSDYSVSGVTTVNVGDKVQRGDVVALGVSASVSAYSSSANSSLKYKLSKRGTKLDPRSKLKQKR